MAKPRVIAVDDDGTKVVAITNTPDPRTPVAVIAPDGGTTVTWAGSAYNRIGAYLRKATGDIPVPDPVVLERRLADAEAELNPPNPHSVHLPI